MKNLLKKALVEVREQLTKRGFGVVDDQNELAFSVTPGELAVLASLKRGEKPGKLEVFIFENRLYATVEKINYPLTITRNDWIIRHFRDVPIFEKVECSTNGGIKILFRQLREGGILYASDIANMVTQLYWQVMMEI